MFIIRIFLCDVRYVVSGFVRFFISVWFLGCSWLELIVNSILLLMLMCLLMSVMCFVVSGLVSVCFSVLWCCVLVLCCLILFFSLDDSFSCMLIMFIRISMNVLSSIDIRLLNVV